MPPPKFWTRERIIAAIHEARRAGREVSYTAVAQSDVRLLRAAVRVFGTWGQALDAAGVDAAARRRWSREDVLAAIRALSACGADLSWTGVRGRDPALLSAACHAHRFGSWPNALRAAGLDERAARRVRMWTSELVVAAIRGRSERGEPLNAGSVERADAGLLSAARRRFGSWGAALEAAGLDPASVAMRRPRNTAGKRTGGFSG